MKPATPSTGLPMWTTAAHPGVNVGRIEVASSIADLIANGPAVPMTVDEYGDVHYRRNLRLDRQHRGWRFPGLRPMLRELAQATTPATRAWSATRTPMTVVPGCGTTPTRQPTEARSSAITSCISTASSRKGSNPGPAGEGSALPRSPPHCLLSSTDT